MVQCNVILASVSLVWKNVRLTLVARTNMLPAKCGVVHLRGVGFNDAVPVMQRLRVVGTGLAGCLSAQACREPPAGHWIGCRDTGRCCISTPAESNSGNHAEEMGT